MSFLRLLQEHWTQIATIFMISLQSYVKLFPMYHRPTLYHTSVTAGLVGQCQQLLKTSAVVSQSVDQKLWFLKTYVSKEKTWQQQ